MEQKSVYFLRDFFWKGFWVALVINIIMGAILIPNRIFLGEFAHQMIGITPETYYEILFNFLANAKQLLLFLFLTPAITLSCMCKCKCKEEN